jgi:hydroxymethylglutaryl-CoA lyase
VALHFHDTYGMAIANALTAWHEFGIDAFDASAGGLGGCPFAPGATGNVATEDLVHALEACGARTGVDIDVVVAASLGLAPHLGRSMVSHLSNVKRQQKP